MDQWTGRPSNETHLDSSKNNFKKERLLKDFCVNIKQGNIHIMGVLEGEGEKGAKKLTWRNNDENFLSVGKETAIQVLESSK